jgi:flagellar hook-associated protein 3 FlgL
MDSVLSDLLILLEKAQTTAAASRNSYLTTQQRDALALQLEGTRDAILSDLNAQFRGDYLFSGSRLDVAPYAKAGGVVQPYAGDDRRLLVDIDRNHPVEVTIDGDSLVHGSDPSDLFAAFDALVAAVRAGDEAGMAAGSDALTSAHSRVTAAQSRVGQVLGTIEAHRSHLTTLGRASNERRAAIEDANLAEAASRMQQADTAYQAALAAAGATSRLTLLDYIR